MKLLALLVAFMLTPAIGFAQNASPTRPTTVDVLAVGGFLGQLDGFCEFPGGTADVDFPNQPGVQSCAGADGKLKQGEWPVALGGLLGARSWIAAERAMGSAPLVVIPGNNQVADFTFLQDRQFLRFWQEMKSLNADAIGLSIEDFVRSLRDPREGDPAVRDRGLVLHNWLQQVTAEGRGLPIIGSNAVIKTRNLKLGNLNQIKAGAFSIDLNEDESAGWLSEITVSHPQRANIVLTLWKAGLVGGPDLPRDQPVATHITDGESDSTTLAAEGTLLPGYRYEVEVRDGPPSPKGFGGTSKLTFQTDSALTPRQNYPYPALDGFPLVARTLADGSPLMILSLVDPGVKKYLGNDAWTWTHGCPADECEIDFLSPSDAVRSAMLRSFANTTDRKPFIILLSALSDAQNQALLEAFPEIRMTILDPTSLALGRAQRTYSPDTKDDLEKRLSQRNAGDQPFSGDLGRLGIFGQRAETRTIVSRPEWVGETAARLSAQVSYSANFEWLLDQPTGSVAPIAGAALTWTPGSCTLRQPTRRSGSFDPSIECTTFALEWPDPSGQLQKIDYGTFLSYQVCEDKAIAAGSLLEQRCPLFANLIKGADFRALAADAFRETTGSDLAIVPRMLIDPDAQAWLSSIINNTHTRVMTRFMLERAIFRSFRMVRATVSGEDLVGKIDDALGSAAYADSCVFGVADSCVDSIDADRPETIKINGRSIDPRSFYAIAMPEGLADELGLPHSRNRGHSTDAVSAIHQRLAGLDGKGWYLDGAQPTLGARLERRAKNGVQVQLLVSSFELGYSDLSLDPNQRASDERKQQLEGLDVEFAGVQPSTKWTRKADIDLALPDTRWLALRGVFNADLSRRFDYGEHEDQLAYENNSFTAGVRLDLKLPILNREVRPYVGRFVDGEIQGPPEYKQAKYTETRTDGFSRVTDATRSTAFLREPRRFTYDAFGVDVIDVWKFFPATNHPWDITKATLQFARGHINKVTNAQINGVPQSEATFADGGAQGVLDAFFDQHRTDFDPTVTFQSIEQSTDHRRWQAELNFEPQLILGSKTWTFGTELRLRRFTHLVDENSLRYYWSAKFSFSMPLATRFELVPAIEFHQANINQTDSQPFRHTKIEANIKIPFVLRAGRGWILFR